MQIRITDNFIANLQSIETYWNDSEFPQGHDQLLDLLTAQVIPNLERYPEIGRLFCRHSNDSVDAINRINQLADQYSAIREYILEDYLLLYSLADSVYLLSIKHHRQLSYDLVGLWQCR